MAPITLYQFSRPKHPAWQHVVNASPPCSELVTWLRIAGVPYEEGAFPPPVAPPKGKFPFISDDGVIVADTSAIIDRLKRGRGADPDHGLTKQEQAIGVAFRRMVKEHLYWVVLHHLWTDGACWDAYGSQVVPQWVGGDTPEATQQRVQKLRKAILDQLQAQGMGRHSTEEVHEMGIVDLTAISDAMGDKPFFLGGKPTTVDAAIYAHLSALIDIPVDGPPARFVRDRRNLAEYCHRMRARFFPELPAR